MLNIVAQYHTKNVKCNSLGLALTITPPPSRGDFVHYHFQILHYISHKMKYVSPLRVAALVCNILLHTLPAEFLIMSNMTYLHFLSPAQVKELLIIQLHNFSNYFINVLSFCRCICYLVFHMLFPSISMAVIEYTCITSVSEYSKSIRLLFK